MNKKRTSKPDKYFWAHILSALLSVLLILNTAGFAYADESRIPRISSWPVSLPENTERTVSGNTLKVKAVGIDDPQGIRLTELILTDLDEPTEEEPYDTTATVTSLEKISWDVPVYWIDPSGKTAAMPTAGQECLPLIVFFVPDGYTTDGLLELTPYLSDVFREAGGVLSIIDHEHGITYITGNAWDLGAPGHAVSRGSSAGETHGESGKSRDDSELNDSYRTDSPQHPEDADSTDKPEQPGGSGETDKPKEPETVEPEEPKAPDVTPSTDEPEEPEGPEVTPPADEPEDPEVTPPADEPEEADPYIAFAEKYKESGYKNISWDEELEALGGIEQVDFSRLVRACGYNASKQLRRSALKAYDDWTQCMDLVYPIRDASDRLLEELYEQADPYLKAHISDKDLIASSNPESLTQFVHMIIDNLIPQSVQLLRENFPAFSAAGDESFSRELGLDIVYNSDEAAAYAEDSYKSSDNLHIGITITSSPYVEDPNTTDGYTFGLTEDSREMPYLKMAVIHEMMHIFMYDYNRTGLMSLQNLRKVENGNNFIPGIGEVTPSQTKDLRSTLKYPLWFIEGTAGLCGTIFTLYDQQSNAMRANKEEAYTASGIYNFCQERSYELSTLTYSSAAITDIYCTYLFGSLAVMYMGELNNLNTTGTSTVHVGADGRRSVDTIAVRNGISDILERMHNGETMDSVIADISGGKYKDAQDFSDKFFNMDGPNMDTMGYVADVLNYVSDLSKEKGAPLNESILKPFDEDILDYIDVTKPVSTDSYVVQDGTGLVKSTVPDEIASKTAGKSDPSIVLGNREDQDSDSSLSGSDGTPAAETAAGPKTDIQIAGNEESSADGQASDTAQDEQVSDTAQSEQTSDAAADKQRSDTAQSEQTSDAAADEQKSDTAQSEQTSDAAADEQRSDNAQSEQTSDAAADEQRSDTVQDEQVFEEAGSETHEDLGETSSVDLTSSGEAA